VDIGIYLSEQSSAHSIDTIMVKSLPSNCCYVMTRSVLLALALPQGSFDVLLDKRISSKKERNKIYPSRPTEKRRCMFAEGDFESEEEEN
jgi:hypothetical protein